MLSERQERIRQALRLTLLVCIFAAACSRAVVPRDTQLWRVDGEWLPAKGSNARTAPGTIIAFRSSGEYVELHAQMIEQPDQTVYFRSGGPFLSAVGHWTQHGKRIDVVREKVGEHISKPFSGGVHPLCKPITFQIEGQMVSGDAGERTTGMYSPVTRLVAPDFESYIDEAKRSPIACAPPK